MQGWIPARTGDGSWTLRHPVHGQACHSLAGAWQEAVQRYARPCRLRELALERPGGVVRLLDVGTGLSLNLAAARAALAASASRLEALTLESDASVLRAAVDLPVAPPDLEVGLSELRAAFAGASQGSSSVSLEATAWAGATTVRLVVGDARCTLPAAAAGDRFDAVFLDPFSPGVEPQLWEPGFLARVAACMEPWAILSTYSAAVGVRRGLAAAGLRLGIGPRVGTKASGTLASRDATLPPLGAREQRRALRAGLRPPPGRP